MSHEGKMRRGLKWYNYRDIDGNLPKDILDDENKMLDVSYYLDNLKEEEKLKNIEEEKKLLPKSKKNKGSE